MGGRLAAQKTPKNRCQDAWAGGLGGLLHNAQPLWYVGLAFKTYGSSTPKPQAGVWSFLVIWQTSHALCRTFSCWCFVKQYRQYRQQMQYIDFVLYMFTCLQL